MSAKPGSGTVTSSPAGGGAVVVLVDGSVVVVDGSVVVVDGSVVVVDGPTVVGVVVVVDCVVVDVGRPCDGPGPSGGPDGAPQATSTRDTTTPNAQIDAREPSVTIRLMVLPQTVVSTHPGRAAGATDPNRR